MLKPFLEWLPHL